jgi:deoxyribodipyrimidine photolyase-related protein
VAQEVGARLGFGEVLLSEVPRLMMSRVIFVPFDHLSLDHGAMKNANPATDLLVLVESQRMLTGRPWNAERLFFMVSAARHFAALAESRGFTVRYLQAPTTADGLRQLRHEFGDLPIVCAEPSSFRQTQQLTELGVEFVENDFFLTSRDDFAMWAGKQKSYVMENFYRKQRVRLGILVVDGAPEGGRWNFDADNRLPPPKNYTWPGPLEHDRDDLDREVERQLNHTATATWATTREGALNQLAWFIEHHLAGFGPYEDAVPQDEWALHHSLLSPYLNVGLLHAREVIQAVLTAYRAGQAPIESVEAIIRQVIGWREYINGMYWFLGEDYRNLNGLGADRDLLPAFSDYRATQMNCVSSVVAGVEKRAWVHHIPRLMVLSNLALVTGVSPQKFLDWMREQFVDASDWVMVPNVIGMATHADSGLLMTKPYAAGGAYLNRMTEFCGGCRYDPKKRVGEDACPFTTLYWDFLDRHRETFAQNHRMGQQLAGLNRLSDLPEVRLRAAEVLQGLNAGTV